MRLVAYLANSRAGHLLRDVVRQPYVYGPSERLILGKDVSLDSGIYNTVSGTITIHDNAFLSHNVALLTGRHDTARTGLDRKRSAPASGCDIVIGNGAWIATNAVIIGPRRIGANAVVCAGAVVTRDVPDDAIVAGVPARVIGTR